MRNKKVSILKTQFWTLSVALYDIFVHTLPISVPIVEAKAPASTTAGVAAAPASQAGIKPTANTTDADAPLTIKEADSKDVTVLLFELLKKLENIPVVGKANIHCWYGRIQMFVK